MFKYFNLHNWSQGVVLSLRSREELGWVSLSYRGMWSSSWSLPSKDCDQKSPLPWADETQSSCCFNSVISPIGYICCLSRNFIPHPPKSEEKWDPIPPCDGEKSYPRLTYFGNVSASSFCLTGNFFSVVLFFLIPHSLVMCTSILRWSQWVCLCSNHNCWPVSKGFVNKAARLYHSGLFVLLFCNKWQKHK